MENRTKILTNPESGADVIDYRISEAEIGPDGTPVPDFRTGSYKTTGRTLEWSIRVGETLRFPEYVADYLLQVYPFLKVVKKVSDDSLVEAESKTQPNG